MYADDLLLLSASMLDLQKMLDICSSVGEGLRMKFSASKSMCIVIGPYQNLCFSNLTLGNMSLPWVESLEYLGICILKENQFRIDLSNVRRKFFTSVNNILSKCTYTSDIVKLSLMESYCLPILLYASESLYLPYSQLADINAWWNSVYRKSLTIIDGSQLNYLYVYLAELTYFISII